MGEVEREKIVDKFEEEERRRLGRFASHYARLMAMESNYGFNLDIAHEVYGDDLLHPDRTGTTVEKWNNLLAAVHEKPGKRVVFIRKYEQNETVCTGFGASPEYTSQAFILSLPNVRPEDFIYNPGNTAQSAYIAIRAEETRSVGASLSQSQAGRYVRLYPNENDAQNTKEILLAHGGETIFPELSVTSKEVTALHDPSENDIYNQISHIPHLVLGLDRLRV